MSVTRIIAQSCWFCREPIVEDTDGGIVWSETRLGRPIHPIDGYKAWTTLLSGGAVHVECLNEATKDRLVQEEKPSA